MNLEDDVAAAIIEAAKDFSPSEELLTPKADDDEVAELLANASAAPSLQDDSVQETSAKEDSRRQELIDMFLQLQGVGEAGATALVDAGYQAIGDIIADIADEVANKTDLPLGVARTIQIAADKYMQEHSQRNDDDDE